jgi:hypothetical protein
LLNEAGINETPFPWLHGNTGSGAIIARQSRVGIVTQGTRKEPVPETTSVQALQAATSAVAASGSRC